MNGAEKIKGYWVRNWEGILAGIIGTVIISTLAFIFKTLWNFLGILNSMNTLYNLVLWVIFALGLSLVIYWVIHFVRKIFTKTTNSSYDAITVEYYEYPWTNVQKNLGVGDFQNFLKIGLLVTNKGISKISCAFRMMDSQYKGYASNNDWVADPTIAEKKLLKWDEGYDTKNGRIDIAPHSGVGKILLAESHPPVAHFWFWLVDGKSENRLLEGIYRVLIQAEIDVERNGILASVRPLNYEVEFHYQQRKLFDVSVKKI
jgi:hypothetical protein